jgi:hypothetical protein
MGEICVTVRVGGPSEPGVRPVRVSTTWTRAESADTAQIEVDKGYLIYPRSARSVSRALVSTRATVY